MIKKLSSIISLELKSKNSKLRNKNCGFTLIELLAAMILATLIITPLLGFMINILDTDRKEQAKINSEQEIQTALDYIAQDLQQAIYIYDAQGVKAIKNELPSKTDRVPVLVFWKREFLEEAIPVRNSKIRRKLNDSFVYSLVAYYLIKSDKKNNDGKWSKQFRIARFELKDGIIDPDNPGSQTNPRYLRNYEPSPGFALFKLNDPRVTGTLEDKMNAWESKNLPTNVDMPMLVDYIDASQDNLPEPVDCENVFNLDNYPATKKADKKKSLKVPAFKDTYSYSTSVNLRKLGNGSFYACVNTDQVSAKIFLRGNAYARINDRDTDYEKSIKNTAYSQARKSYFPTASVQVKGRGLLGVE